ncbi:hypothetical protein [Pectobacterium jejuense]|uniref:hypothetical protein n=1 Tax=Pectobacterium jejuense TaxID=2974022 RepID=UPI002280234F|nr:hypothetical protein [Pectobacterium jejuense]MCY9849836.1 hypothetical protein [Pectobacterium jejuense]
MYLASLSGAHSSKVGYESPSQFSREYRRLFGVPAKKDITALREQTSPSGMQS